MSGPININSKGYGKIYKTVMHNRQLPLLAKTIYSYFCAYAGNGCQAYPKRDKIVRDLKLHHRHMGIVFSPPATPPA